MHRGADTAIAALGVRTRTSLYTRPNLSQTRVVLLLYNTFIIITTERIVTVLTEIRHTIVSVWSRAVYTPENLFLFSISGIRHNMHVGSNIYTLYTVPMDFPMVVRVIILLHYS